MIDTASFRSDTDSDMDSYPPLPPSPMPSPLCRRHPVRMLRTLNPLCTEERTLLNVSSHGLVFALLLSAGEHENDINHHLNERVSDCLRTLRSILDNLSTSTPDLLLPVSSAPSRAILFDGCTSTTSVVSTAPYSGHIHLFAAYELFQRHHWLQEIIRRSTSNQWFASRKSPATLAGEVVHKIALLEAGNSQASLVDVDAELSILIRQRAWW